MDINIRELSLDDVDDEFVSWYQNDDGHLNFFTGSRRSFVREDLQKMLGESIHRNEHFFLVLTKSGDRIGTVKIGPVDYRNKTSDLVCMIGTREYLGRGLAALIISHANEIAFQNLDIRRLHGGMYETNVASIKAYTRAGWYIEGKMKGYYWVNGAPMDRICVACLNPAYFPDEVTNEN